MKKVIEFAGVEFTDENGGARMSACANDKNKNRCGVASKSQSLQVKLYEEEL
jgi:hypothetical protein